MGKTLLKDLPGETEQGFYFALKRAAGQQVQRIPKRERKELTRWKLPREGAGQDPEETPGAKDQEAPPAAGHGIRERPPAAGAKDPGTADRKELHTIRRGRHGQTSKQKLT